MRILNHDKQCIIIKSKGALYNMNTPLREVGILYNALKPGAKNNAARLRHAFMGNGVHCRTVRCFGESGATGEMTLDQADFTGCQLLCVLGGDGTLLAALQRTYAYDIPLMGINMGRMGFLSEVQPDDIERDVAQLMRGDYRLEPRMLLEAHVPDSPVLVALNEVAINRSGYTASILALEVYAGGVLVDRFSGDGLIVASSTGSTAYSLSAGGPIVAPGLNCVVLTPVCSHTLHVRPVVVSPDMPIEVRVLGNPSSARVMLDGHTSLPFPQDAPLCIRRAANDIRFMKLHDQNFFDLLRKKLSDWTH